MSGLTESLASSEAKRLADKYDNNLDIKVRKWLSALVNQPLDMHAPLTQVLKSGVIICKALNAIKKGSIANIYEGNLPYKQMENVNSYLVGCKALGMAEHNMFLTVDLYDDKDPLQVLSNLNHLASMCASMPGYHGPTLNNPVSVAPAPTPVRAPTSTTPRVTSLTIPKATTNSTTSPSTSSMGGAGSRSSFSAPKTNTNAPSTSNGAAGNLLGVPSGAGSARGSPSGRVSPRNRGRAGSPAVGAARGAPRGTSASPRGSGSPAPRGSGGAPPPRGGARGSPLPPRGGGGAPPPRGGARGGALSPRNPSAGRNNGATNGAISPRNSNNNNNNNNATKPTEKLTPSTKPTPTPAPTPTPEVPKPAVVSIERAMSVPVVSTWNNNSTSLSPSPSSSTSGSGSASTTPKKQPVFDSQLSYTGQKSTSHAPLKKAQTKSSWARDEPPPAHDRVASVSSLDNDIATKEMFKYDPEMEKSVIDWLEQVSGEKKNPALSVHEWLQDGVLLCNVLNIIRPNTVKPPVISKVSFKHRENIAAYLDACQNAFGLKATTLFQTVDLYEEKNMHLVLISIHNLATEVGENPAYKCAKIRKVVASANNVLLSASFVDGLPVIQESAEVSDEEKLMLEWLNSHLKHLHRSVTRICSGLRDGTVLIHLLEYFTGTRLGTSYEKRATNLWHCMQNSTLALKFIHQQTGEKCPTCTGRDITMGNLPAIVSLLKFVRSKFDRDFVFKSQNLTVDSCRIRILEELSSTEQTYVSQMQLVQQKILSVVKTDELLPEEEIHNVFSNLSEILEFNERFLKDLLDRVALSAQDVHAVFSDLFLSRDQFVPLYSKYINNYDMASLMVKFNKKKFKEFKKIIKSFEKEQSESTGLDLDSFLILPVQRMPRYLLLLKELLKYTPESHQDFDNIVKAVDYISKALQTINENKRHAETSNTSHKILSIDKSMVYEMDDFEGIVHPKRVYIFEGVLKWEDMEEDAENPYWFLFNDILVFCSDLSGTPDAPPDKQFRYITLMPLRFIDSVEEDGNNELAFNLVMEDESITLEAKTVASKVEWIKQINDAKALGADLDLVW